jgi:hypothetical protein
LGESRAFFHAGELRYLWEKGVDEDRLCGCGKTFSACSFWSEVLERAFGGRTAIDTRFMRSWEKKVSGFRKQDVSELLERAEFRSEEFARYLEQLGSLYTAIGELSGKPVVVDSSKSPYYLLLLSQLGEIQLSILHLVRDPRAVAFSLLRKRAQPDPKDAISMRRFRPDRSARRWNQRNQHIQDVRDHSRAGYLMLRYEDFVKNPRHALEQAHALVGVPEEDQLFGEDLSVDLGENHGVWGNPSRFRRGRTELRADEEWRTKMSWGARATVALLTRPFRRQYGY